MNAPLRQSERPGRLTLLGDPVPMTPPKRSPVPEVDGSQTAVVVGEGEIGCDVIRATNGSCHHIAGASEEPALGNRPILVRNQHRNQRLTDLRQFFDHVLKSADLTVFRGLKRDMRLGQGDRGSSHIEAEGGFTINAKEGVELRAARGFDPNTQQEIDLQFVAKLNILGATGFSFDASQVMALSAGQALTLNCGTARIILH